MNHNQARVRLSLLSVSLLLAGAACGGPVPSSDGGAEPPADGGQGLTFSLLTTVPSAGASGAPLDSALALGFSLPVAPASLSVDFSPAVTLGSPTWGDEGTEVSYPALALMSGTSYTVTVAATGVGGAVLDGARSFTFTTTTASDSTPPILASSSPQQGASTVAPGQAITLTFSEKMSADSLSLTLEPEQELGAAVWNPEGTVATVSPVMPLLPGTPYILTLAGADQAGNPLASPTQLTFSTAAAADTEAPTVLSSAPAPAAAAVPVNAALSFSFSEPMNTAAVDGAFSIAPAVAGTVLWDATGTLRSFQPAAPLAASTQYTLTLGVAAADLAGNGLAAPHTLTFTTAAAPDVTPPAVVSTTPAQGATGLWRYANISVTFSEPMDKASVQVAFAVVLPANFNAGSFNWSADGKTMTFNPTGVLEYGHTVSWRLNAGARDLAGNPLPVLVRSFQVVRFATVVIDSSPGVDGWASNGSTFSASSTSLAVGDSGSNISYRGFLSFDLSGLPTNLTRLTEAMVNAYVSGAQGEPTDNLGGGARLQRLTYGDALTAAAYDKAPFVGTGDDVVFANTKAVGWRGRSMVFGVTDDWANRASRGNRTQFLIRTPNALFPNSLPDLFSFYSGNSLVTNCPRVNGPGTSCKPYLVVSYEYP